ncbi:hypothetical protein SAMN05443572_101251 [Myxococcus fulvus]|uniref:Type 4 fimbrial biogenesis protein PilX N-terminal domain-containing protein n=1 Tax=Myxococcus fulvus TaxID=33 RepID=A0A511T0N3_MYXFU|nr:hypothetical protein [Myxococcus fulvus]AKF79247.1 hypothetical protein MFUL124B02_02140 [Myxococcus fulvus 124B02]GEN07724.1 hypothetical protein MFU01_27610 [Myxococcus fulvus]SES81794.1 hypothetical protein SAMN05443572_101251 [Myxococcus fulvus]
MTHRDLARTRANGGFTLLVALGVVLVVTMAVMLSYRVVGREADTQADARRQKEAFFAAEAGLAEGREAIRLRTALDATTYENTLMPIINSGAEVTELGLAGANPPWYELLPAGPGDPWNYLRLTPNDMPAHEKQGADNVAYADYPEQNNVRYRVFVRDDIDFTPAGSNPNSDSNGLIWVAAVGEVLSRDGRPTRSVVQALIANQTGAVAYGPGCNMAGCGSDNNYNNSREQNAPDTTQIETLPNNTPP